MIIICWMFCSLIACGCWLAHCQREFPTIAKDEFYSDRKMAIAFASLGPITILIILLKSGFKHGLMFCNPHKKRN